jgi:hypothetical protein
LTELRANGAPQAACVGRVTSMTDVPRITLTP